MTKLTFFRIKSLVGFLAPVTPNGFLGLVFLSAGSQNRQKRGPTNKDLSLFAFVSCGRSHVVRLLLSSHRFSIEKETHHESGRSFVVAVSKAQKGRLNEKRRDQLSSTQALVL